MKTTISSFIFHENFSITDEGGIYKGRLNYRERVREIEDTRDTKVEIPVNFRELETVEVKQSFAKEFLHTCRHFLFSG